MISRLTDQKGFDLLAEILEELFSLDIGFVLLGTGEQKYHDLFGKVAQRYPKKAGIRIAYDDRLAHQIEAGADLFLMPSKYEPCGLNQIYSLKYGTIPVVRATGGLDDTIRNYDPATQEGNGFKFDRYDAKELFAQIKKAIHFYDQPDHWERLLRNAMKADFSWEKSAEAYVQLYRKALKKKTLSHARA
jgi:starch synthase